MNKKAREFQRHINASHEGDSTSPFQYRPLPTPIGCAVDGPLMARPISDDDLVRVADENYKTGRKHGKEELADEIETLIYWLLRAYQSGHREGWEPGPSTDETMSSLCSVLANRGFDPNESEAAKNLMKRIERY